MTLPDLAPVPIRRRRADHVVLLDPRGRPAGIAPKHSVHGLDTPFHLGFSCHVVDERGAVLVTRRATAKQTWPGVWTNACCGHPRWGESIEHAVERRLREELGVHPTRLAVAVPDFVYRATMDDGTVEHELCPVVVAAVDRAELDPDPREVDDLDWVRWDALCDRARTRPDSLTPWSARQVVELAALAPSPEDLLDRSDLDPRYVNGFGGLHAAKFPGYRRQPVEPFAGVRTRVEERLGSFVAAKAREITALDRELAPIAAEVSALVDAGGKRLRPAFVHWGYRATGADDDDAVFTVAAAIELLHTFALLHDDVIDRSDLRRGRPSAGRALAALHDRDGLAGDADWFGTSAAILAGDLAFVWADELLDAADLDAPRRARVRAAFDALRVEVTAGQYLDLRLAARPAADEFAARRVALLKSGRYTVTRPLQLGLALARTSDAALAVSLQRYGDAVGVAFQMRDDVLGLFGDPAETGKSCVDDLREGKRTVLIVRALALADEPGRRQLEHCLGNPELEVHEAVRCREIVATSGALASVEMSLHTRLQLALDAIVRVPEPARGALEALASLAVDRQV